MARKKLEIKGTVAGGKVESYHAPFFVIDEVTQQTVAGPFEQWADAKKAYDEAMTADTVYLVRFSRTYQDDYEYLAERVNSGTSANEDEAMIDQLLAELNEADAPPSRILGLLEGGLGDVYYILAEYVRPYNDQRKFLDEMQEIAYDEGGVDGRCDILLVNGEPLAAAA